jgi:hypothetical protein
MVSDNRGPALPPAVARKLSASLMRLWPLARLRDYAMHKACVGPSCLHSRNPKCRAVFRGSLSLQRADE